MAGEHAPSSVESLRAETAWLRRLASALTRNDAAADDVVQDTWVARLAHPPHRPGPLVGWLSVVLRNVVRKRARTDSRRQAREKDAQALSEGTVPDAGTLAVRLEAQRLVSELVLALDEPYRSTVLLCCYEGLSRT